MYRKGCYMSISIFIVVVLLAAILQTSTGFGFSIMATPFLLLLFEAKEAIQINILLSLVISVALISKIRKDVNTKVLKRFILGSMPGLALGIIIFLTVNAKQLKVGIGVAILLLTILLISKIRLRSTNRRDLIVGGLSGALTTGIGMPGPPLLLYFSGTDTGKGTLRATTLMFYLYIYSVSLLIQVIFAGTTKLVWTSSSMALPLIFIGLYIGQRLFHWMPKKVFQVFVYVILLFTGMILLFST